MIKYASPQPVVSITFVKIDGDSKTFLFLKKILPFFPRVIEKFLCFSFSNKYFFNLTISSEKSNLLSKQYSLIFIEKYLLFLYLEI